MTAEADNIRLWTSLRSLRGPLLQRLNELNDEDRRRTLAENHIASYLANPSTVSPPSIIEEPTDYIGQEWIDDVIQVAAKNIEAQGFGNEAEFLKQQCQFGKPGCSTPNELEAVRNMLDFIDSNESALDVKSKKPGPKVPEEKIKLGQLLQFDWLTYLALGHPNDEDEAYDNWRSDCGWSRYFDLSLDEAKKLRKWFSGTHLRRHEEDAVSLENGFKLSEDGKTAIGEWLKSEGKK